MVEKQYMKRYWLRFPDMQKGPGSSNQEFPAEGKLKSLYPDTYNEVAKHKREAGFGGLHL
jgi:hypothetical protein